MIRKNNRGLSLVELIVAVAILAVVGVGIMGFVAFSSRNYTQANKNVKLQYEQQMTVNRIRDIVLETSRAIAYDDTTKALTVFSDTAGSSLAAEGIDAVANPIIVSRIYFTEPAEGEDAGKLFLLTKTLTSSEVDGKKYSEIGITGTGDELTDTVKDFSADLSNVGKGKVTLHITFKVGEREVEVHPEIALRNQIDVLTDDSEIDKIYEKEIIEFTSNVGKVEISRDGKIFGQAKTDTIEMAGDSTTVDYDAIVTKKSYYKGTIDTSVTWELENVKEGYEACIVLDPATGMLTLKNNGTKKPTDYMNGETFIIKAISNEDPSKLARLRIKVGTNGVYPKTINYAETHKQDLLNSQLIYTFTHEIEYTSPIKNSEGNLVNPLIGNDVYAKIKYTVYGPDKTTLATVPKGAGFSTTGTDGVFRVVKSMEEQTYNIKASVLQKDKDGKEVFCWITLYIEKGSVPDGDTELTVPQLYTSDEYKRADYNPASVQWTHGVPFYKEGDNEIPYYYWYEWEIEPVDGWGDSAKTRFTDNAYLYFGGNQGTSYTTYMTDRMGLIYIEPRLDWSGTFTMKVSVRAKLSKTGKDTKTYKYRARPNVKVYKYDAQDNDKVDGYALAADTQVWTNLLDYNSANGGSLKVNWNWKDGYINASDVDVRISARNNSISVYNAAWGGSGSNIANPNVYYRGYQGYQNYPVYVLAENRNNTAQHKKGYVSENDLNISFYTNKAVTRYEKPGEINEVIATVGNNGADIEVLDTTGSKHKIRINGQVGYVHSWDYYSEETTTNVDPATLPYYRLPTEEKAVYDFDDITTTNRDDAYVSSKIVKINPVKLTLTPVETQFYKHNTVNQTKLTAYFNTSSTVYLGKGKYVDDIGYNATEDYRYYGVEEYPKGSGKYKGYKLDNVNPSDSEVTWYCDYYKCFTPTFTGIKVDRSNYSQVLGGIRKTLNSTGTTALQPYVYDKTLGTVPQNMDVSQFDSGIVFNVDNQLYMYVKMTPYYWGEKFTSFPSGVRWVCVVEGKDSSNFVIANTTNGEYYYFNYTAKKELDPTPVN